ncbi:MAG: glycosyltransferase family 2 protein [Anaerolineales bacterium]
MVDVSVIVVSYNTRELLAESLRSAFTAHDDLSVEIWVVDNASMDGSPEIVAAQFPDVRLIRNPQNTGFAAANNQALRAASGRFLMLLNSDAALLPGCLAVLRAAFVEHEGLGICGPCLLNPDGSLQPSWGDFPTPKVEFLFQSFLYKLWPTRFPYGRRVHVLLRPAYRRFQWVDWVTGAALMLRREVFEKIGGLPADVFMYGEDLEYCARARQAGFRVAYVPAARARHHQQKSSRRDFARWIEKYTRATLAYYRRHGSADDRRWVAHLIISGSRLRQVLWRLVGAVRPGWRAEAKARGEGYARAVALAYQTLDDRMLP